MDQQLFLHVNIPMEATHVLCGEGDAGLIYDVIRVARGDRFDQSSVTLLDRSVESHLVTFAAEESRLRGGEVIDFEAFIKGSV